jgi:hypothetical protein
MEDDHPVMGYLSNCMCGWCQDYRLAHGIPNPTVYPLPEGEEPCGTGTNPTTGQTMTGSPS